MRRRDFLKTTAATAAGIGALGPSFLFGRSPYLPQFADMRKRVGLIGSGWYGKADLLRLIQVAPVEVVSLCDVDSVMVSEAADLVAARQVSKKRPRTYRDYREMLKEKDLDVVLIGTPDHWHALTMIEAARAGADLYVQKPISIDVTEGQAMVAAARKYGRVVQVGTQRRSTPHLATARDRFIREGRLGTIAHVEIYCYYHMRTRENPPDIAPPAALDWEFYQGPAPARAFNKLIHPRGWRAFMEYSNGIVGDMCIHMLDMVRWMMDLGMPARISSSGGILVDKGSKANTTDTQSATFDFGNCKWCGPIAPGAIRRIPKYPWGATFYGDKGTLKASVMGLRLRAARRGPARTRRREVRARGVSGRQDRKGSRTSCRAGDPRPYEGPADQHPVARQTRCRHRAGLHVDHGLHSGEPLGQAGPVDHVGSCRRQGRRDTEANALLTRPYRSAVGPSRSHSPEGSQRWFR
jgi:predicted dehydrogenase